jgi:thiamine pyrophosphate-dependent acetolactate synthase large subunit-like protein
MFKFEMSGFDEIERQLQQLADNVEAMDGEHSVPLTELCPPAFMAEHTDFATIEEMFGASGFTVETPEDFAAIPDAEWDAFVASRSRFADWRTMQEKAAADWISRGIGLA